jgi:hypothetical protein
VVPHSIRRRLPLSYAAIALLAALVLGAVLLLTLRSYYLRVEREYLRSNAQAIALNLAELLEEDAPTEVLQARLDTSALLSDARVHLFDAQGQWVASSERTGARPFLFARFPALLPLAADERGEWVERLRSLLQTMPRANASATPASGSATPTPTLGDAQQSATPAATRRQRIVAIERAFPVAPADEGEDSGIYSSQVVQLPIFDSENALLGFVQLSH